MDNREFGKFASGKELLHAYLELEKEYTRKCQKLAELIKKIEIVEEEQNDKNAEFCGESDEYSVKNAQNKPAILEIAENLNNENKSGIIASEDACCNSTDCICDAKNDVSHDGFGKEHDLDADGKKRPIYLSPMFGFWAKEFFATYRIAAVFEKEILDLIAADEEISCLPNALEAAAERVVGKYIMQPVLGDQFVEALCTMPQIKQKVIDLYVAGVRSRYLPPASVRVRSSAATTRAKFDSIAEASKHLLTKLS